MSDVPWAEELRTKINKELDQWLPDEDETPTRLHRAMRYSVLNGGKRLRPTLCIVAGRMVSESSDPLLKAAVSVEFIHTYSLIHDDLPCMDDDDMRRGMPSCHVEFDRGTAILAGDALQALAFDVVSQVEDQQNSSRLGTELANASGSRNLVGGQQLDLLLENQDGSLEDLRDMHLRKTAALITASLRMGVIAGEGTKEQLEHITEVGEKIGLAFQITDDILDVEGSTEDLGKTAGKDEISGKLTYPSLVGIDRARRMAREQVKAAVEALEPFGDRADPLRKITRFIVNRNH